MRFHTNLSLYVLATCFFLAMLMFYVKYIATDSGRLEPEVRGEYYSGELTGHSKMVTFVTCDGKEMYEVTEYPTFNGYDRLYDPYWDQVTHFVTVFASASVLGSNYWGDGRVMKIHSIESYEVSNENGCKTFEEYMAEKL